MTGGSLGLRTGSYGSLQPQLQNGVTLPIQSTSVSARKPPKMLPLGSREKEKIILPWICKFCGKRKVGMLLLLIASVAVFLSFISVLNKDDDASSGLETNLFSSDNVWTMKNNDIKSPYTLGGPLASVNNDMDNISSSGSHFPVPMFSPSILPVRHPCENISLYPVQIDRKRTGPRPCPVCYVPVEQAAFYMPAFPSKSPILKNLTYVVEENSYSNESSGGFIFGGHPSLNQRNDSFDIKESMTVHCGFVGGKKPGQGTAFDIHDDDLLEMDKCHDVVVASAIFGKYDVMQQPKNISEVSKRSVCFYMFLDEETEAYIKNSSSVDSTKRVGLWRIVVVRNLPYEDARRNGKVPKLLLHRLFPNARFSLWVDGKLELVVDPYQVLERYKQDSSQVNANVPEGCVIIREHIPITNLFTCIWFNEVDRFTSRDQLSFSTVRDKIMLKVNWTVDMFMDCERRNFVIQAYHRDLLEQRKALAALRQPPPLMLTKELPSKPAAPQIGVPRSPLKKLPVKHRKSGSRRHRPKAVNSKDQLNITGLS
ncbi:hypothetical protein KFK09_014071 [Dendrobium nobile]|uniref:TOD1/MUCI70 glycosyltransferase-like domain-containing protein n=1 Tax=Dendrobium nobile TaxID=94219 RepID=A0A8T3B8Y0_DENNO|nr:hypothetical protein KFK09_014071 [Dendrobium nobile]